MGRTPSPYVDMSLLQRNHIHENAERTVSHGGRFEGLVFYQLLVIAACEQCRSGRAVRTWSSTRAGEAGLTVLACAVGGV
jgi:hypothetical protein